MSEYKPATSSKVTAVISAAPLDASLSISPSSVKARVEDTTTFSGKLTGTVSGNPIEGKTIHLYINGVNTGKNAVTDSNGDYSIDVEWTKEGTLECITRYLGD